MPRSPLACSKAPVPLAARVTCNAGHNVASLLPTAARGRSVGRRGRRPPPPQAFLTNLLRSLRKEPPAEERVGPSPADLAVQQLLLSVEGTERGLTTSQEQREGILAAVAALADLGASSTTTAADDLSATWRLVWTTEKETLFILDKAELFGTQAGDVFQVIDVEAGSLQNVICFPPEGAFIVDSAIASAGPQRTEFQFTSATLKLPGGRALKLPPFGKGWFDTLYVDNSIRVAQDSRGDTLIVARAGPPQRFS